MTSVARWFAMLLVSLPLISGCSADEMKPQTRSHTLSVDEQRAPAPLGPQTQDTSVQKSIDELALTPQSVVESNPCSVWAACGGTITAALAYCGCGGPITALWCLQKVADITSSQAIVGAVGLQTAAKICLQARSSCQEQLTEQWSKVDRTSITNSCRKEPGFPTLYCQDCCAKAGTQYCESMPSHQQGECRIRYQEPCRNACVPPEVTDPPYQPADCREPPPASPAPRPAPPAPQPAPVTQPLPALPASDTANSCIKKSGAGPSAVCYDACGGYRVRSPAIPPSIPGFAGFGGCDQNGAFGCNCIQSNCSWDPQTGKISMPLVKDVACIFNRDMAPSARCVDIVPCPQ